MKKINQSERLLNFIKEYKDDNGFPPTMREMKKALNFKSISTVSYYLDKLQDQGLIKKQANKNRALDIINTENNDNVASIQQINKSNMIAIPVLGVITAGEPILAVENCEEYFMVSPNMFKGDDLFMLTISGESMINAGIFDGDKVVLRQQNTANNGDIVAALIDGSATVKKFYKEDGRYRLQPENDFMQPIIVNNVEIIGKVVGLVRKF